MIFVRNMAFFKAYPLYIDNKNTKYKDGFGRKKLCFDGAARHGTGGGRREI
jgi:hypothetical protein